MEMVFQGLLWNKIALYFDDVIVKSQSIEEGIGNLQIVFNRLRNFNLKLQAKKCNLLATEVQYLGH
jgi:hypothetical protein